VIAGEHAAEFQLFQLSFQLVQFRADFVECFLVFGFNRQFQ
jgi:hypothetical protein